MRYWGAFVAFVLCLTCYGAPSTAAAHPKPSEQRAAFKVVVEGSGMATRQVDVDGTNGACQVSSHTTSEESFGYGRGKGLTVVFKRFRGIRRSPISLMRAGQHSFRPTFNVRGWYRGVANGEATRFGESVCEPLTESVGDGPQCRRKFQRAVDMALTFERRKLTLELASPELVPLPGSGCGSNSIETLSGSPAFGWGGFVDLEPEPLAPRLIFGKSKGFVVHYRSRDTMRRESPNPAFQGAAYDTGEHEAVVHFIRVRS